MWTAHPSSCSEPVTQTSSWKLTLCHLRLESTSDSISKVVSCELARVSMLTHPACPIKSRLFFHGDIIRIEFWHRVALRTDQWLSHSSRIFRSPIWAILYHHSPQARSVRRGAHRPWWSHRTIHVCKYATRVLAQGAAYTLRSSCVSTGLKETLYPCWCGWSSRFGTKLTGCDLGLLGSGVTS